VKRNKFSIRLLKLAEDDLTEIVTYIADDNVSAAEKLASRIEKSLKNLSEHPYMGKIPDDEALSRLRYRYIIVENYLIFYTVESRAIVVHRIIHGARDYKGFT
jgi:toxin ParE1/3/4